MPLRAPRDAGATRAGASPTKCFEHTNTFPVKEPCELPDQWPACSDDHNDASKMYGPKICINRCLSRLTEIGSLASVTFVSLLRIFRDSNALSVHILSHKRRTKSKKPDVAKLTYLEVLEDLNNVQGEAWISSLRTIILQRLISIYRLQQNLLAVERISKPLAENISRSPDITVHR